MLFVIFTAKPVRITSPLFLIKKTPPANTAGDVLMGPLKVTGCHPDGVRPYSFALFRLSTGLPNIIFVSSHYTLFYLEVQMVSLKITRKFKNCSKE